MLPKKIISTLLAMSLVAASCSTAFAVAITNAPATPVAPIEISCKSAILMEISTGEVMFEYNADEKLAPASITKVMTMLLVMEAVRDGDIAMQDKVVASPYACSMGGSQIWLEPGESMSVDEMLRAAAIGSANDAAVALAEHVAGSEAAFVQRMNERAAELGLENTHFVNSCGLDEPDHYTSARDIGTMSRELLKYPEIIKYTSTWMDTLRGGETELVNTNKLVRFYEGCNGLKTGTTDSAGTCLAASAARGNMGLVAVVLGSKTSDDRFNSTRTLLDYGFANFVAMPAPDISEELLPIRVKNGCEQFVQGVGKPPQVLLAEKTQKGSVEQKVELDETVQAPVQAGQQIGKVTVFIGGTPKYEYPIVAQADIAKMDIPAAFSKLITEMSR